MAWRGFSAAPPYNAGVAIHHPENGGTMKRVVILLMLPVITAGVLMAQGFHFSGSIETGAVLIFPGDEEGFDEKTDVQLKSEGVDGKSNRFRLAGEFDQVNYGLKMRLQLDFDRLLYDVDNVKNDYGFNLKDQYAYVWGDFFHSMLRLSAGKFDDLGVWNTMFDEKWTLEELRTGIRAEIKPGYGFNFGAAFAVPPQDANPDEKYNIQRFVREMVLGVRYDSDLFSLSGAFAMDGNDNLRSDEQALTFGFVFKGLRKLQAGVEAKFEYLGSTDDLAFTLLEKAGYDISRSFYAQVKLYQERESGGDGFILKVFPDAYYKFNPRLELGCELGFEGTSSDFGATAQLSIKPKFYYHLGANATLYAYAYSQFIHFYNEIGLAFYWSF
jgi:hypothetical protein